MGSKFHYDLGMYYKKYDKNYKRSYKFHCAGEWYFNDNYYSPYYAYLAVVIAAQIAPVYIHQWLVKSSLERKLHSPHMGAHKEKRVG